MAFRTAPAFVDSIWELFGPLLAGVPLGALPPAASRDPAQASRVGATACGGGSACVVGAPAQLARPAAAHMSASLLCAAAPRAG